MVTCNVEATHSHNSFMAEIPLVWSGHWHHIVLGKDSEPGLAICINRWIEIFMKESYYKGV